MTPDDNTVNRPIKKSEFTIHFGTSHAEKGWRDLKATRLNGLVDVWEYLTKSPQAKDPTCYPLRGRLETVSRNGQSFDVWQKKLSLTDDARIWFYVDGNRVVLDRVYTHHPNQTK